MVLSGLAPRADLLAVAVLLDLLLGDPVYPWHPIRLVGRSLRWIEARLRGLGADGYLGGCVLFIALTLFWGGGTAALLHGAGRLHPVAGAALHLFPQLEGTQWEYEWAGWPAITRDHLPKLFALDQGVYAGLGYNGRGVASATMMGQQLANVVLAQAEPLVEVRGPERFAFHRFRQAGISFHLLTGTLLDRFDRRGAA